MNRITLTAATLLLSSAALPAASAWFDSASKPEPYCAKVGVVMDGPTGIQITLECRIPQLIPPQPSPNVDAKKDRGGKYLDRIAPVALPVNTQPVRDSVRLYPDPESPRAHLDVLVGGQPMRMMLDTGAAACLIPHDIATKLVNDGAAHDIGQSRFTMADSTIATMRTVIIHEVRIGRHVIRDVKAGVTLADKHRPLLSFPVLTSIGPFTIDMRAGELTFH
jgi:Aspartyl protease